MFCQDGLLPWSAQVAGLNHFKSGFELALDRDDAKQMDGLWRKLGSGIKNKDYIGTFGKVGYEGGYLLRISSDNEFILLPYFDEDLISDYSYGTITETDTGEFVLHPKKELRPSQFGLRQIPLDWVTVMGGRFVVPRDEIKLFGNYYGGFGAYNGFPRMMLCDGCGTFAQRLDRNMVVDRDKTVAPQKYLKYIRLPIDASIISVGRRFFATRINFAGIYGRSSVTKVRVNVGSASGVRAGLMFFLIGAGDNFYQVLKITRTYRTNSDAEIVRPIDSSGQEVYDGEYNKETEESVKIPFPPIKVGLKITTSPIVNNPMSDLEL